MAGAGVFEELWRSALGSVDPATVVARFFSGRPPSNGRRRGLFACGKAALAMARGAPRYLFDSTLVIASRDSPVPPSWRDRVIFGAHPEPDASSVAAARAALSFFRNFGPGDEVVALLSGGASSLLCLPRKGLSLAEKRRRIRRAMRAGWPIDRLNRLRVSLSAVKGGLLADSTPARVTTLVLSDVPGADFRIVGSGPTVRATKLGDRAFLLADNRTGLLAAAAAAAEAGVDARVERRPLSGSAAEAGGHFARRLRSAAKRHGRPFFLIAGGETTVSISGRSGVGGRNQEFALAAALEIEGDRRLSILAAGSDGIDGNSENAGAFVDGATTERARRRGFDPAVCLERHDSAAFFEVEGGAFRPGATGTNVADWVFGYAARKSEGRSHGTMHPMKILLRSLLLAALCVPAAARAQSTSSPNPAAATAPPPRVLKYRFVPQESVISFELPTSFKVIHGKVNSWQGSVEVDPATPGVLRAMIQIRADSIETGNARRDLDVRDKVLEAARFSQIVFEAKTYKGNLSKFHPGATLTAELAGDIEIHGVKNPLQTSVECAVLSDHVVVAGAVPVFWKAFGVKDMSRFFVRVRDPLLVVFRLWAVPEP